MESKCDQANCTAPDGGPCLSGNADLATCPHFTSDEDVEVEFEIESQEASDTVIKQPRPIRLAINSAEPLTLEEANAIVAQYPSRLILIAGEANSGKTTLISEIFNLFQRRPVANALFAGSHSLMGFERRCHLARITSMAPRPDTERTKRGHNNLILDLLLRTTVGDVVQILLPDLPGELFKAAIVDNESASQVPFVNRADVICILIDGEMLASGRTRIAAMTSARRLLQRLLVQPRLTQLAKVQLVITKWDLVLNADSDLESQGFVNQWQEKFLRDFVTVAVSIHMTSARSAEPTGMDELMESWLQEAPSYTAPQAHAPQRERMMGRFEGSVSL